ncbi:aminoglycoside phosphotransferase family protein [Brevibacillus fluminis]|uniref:aminoglycoside phosphotransferase family protein n=1 Tax=Brevibacillus fluminis TaxID=511487 RepID=UPI001FEC050D|nr:aminoglycoside phosphotransferase family protein [Brevibacillus fluminis]
MAREKLDLKQVYQRYKVRVIHMTPKKDYYLLETNRGPKELRVWPRVDVMRWSFAWREQLARHGVRDVERFIRTRDAKPYVVLAKKGFTLTDHVPQAETLLPDSSQSAHCGSVVAAMHKAQQADSFFTSEEVLKKEQMLAAEEVKRAREVFAQFVEGKDDWSEADAWVASQFPPLLERMERSAELLQAVPPDEEWLSVSHRELTSHNWGMHDGRLILRGFYRPVLSVQHRDTAGFLREVIMQDAESAKVQSFLDGYEETKPLTYSEYQMLLAFMAFPEETWKSVESYVTQVPSEREKAGTSDIEAAIRRQEQVDALLLEVAERAERTRSERLS